MERCTNLVRSNFTDSASGKASIQPHTDDEGADEADERGAAIDAYANAKCSCDHLVATWLLTGSGEVLERDLRVVIGARHDNEVVIETRVNSRAVDYVTNQLRYFSRTEA